MGGTGSLGVIGSLTCAAVSRTTTDDQRWTKRQAGSAAEWRWKGQALGSQRHTGDTPDPLPGESWEPSNKLRFLKKQT